MLLLFSKSQAKIITLKTTFNKCKTKAATHWIEKFDKHTHTHITHL